MEIIKTMKKFNKINSRVKSFIQIILLICLILNVIGIELKIVSQMALYGRKIIEKLLRITITKRLIT